MTGESLPASVTVRKDVGEADPGHDFARRIEDLVQATHEPEAPFHVCPHFREVIRAGLALRDMREHLAARVEGTIDVGVFEFLGHHAGDCIRVVSGE